MKTRARSVAIRNRRNHELVEANLASRLAISAFLATLLCLLSLLVLPPTLPAQVQLKNFKFPELYERETPGQPDRLKALVTGAEARTLSNDFYLVKQVRIEHFREDGATNLIAQAPECLLDGALRTASSTNRLAIETGNGLFIEGDGFFCQLTNFHLTLSNRVRTVVRAEFARSAGPVRLAPARPAGTNADMKIFSDRFDYDYQSNLIHYAGRVRVDHPQMDLTCERLTIRRSTNGLIEQLIAEPSVLVVSKQDGSRATGQRAVYTMRDGREVVELSGDARWQDDLRSGQAESFAFDLKANTIHARRHASIKLPRSAVGQPHWLGGKTNATTIGTNDFIEIAAEFLDAQLPTTNRPARTVAARTNVVITSAADQSRATSERASYSEATGVLELTGHAVWQADQRLVKGETLSFDRTNRTFAARRDAFLKLPLTALGRSPRAPSVKPAAPQFIEVACEDIDYRADLLTFRERVRSRFLEGDVARGSLNSGSLALTLRSNRVESATARRGVTLEQFATPAPGQDNRARRLDCELLTLHFWTNGQVRRLVAATNVIAQQSEWRLGTPKPSHTLLRAETFTADFFAHTNQVREAIAERNVSMVQDDRRARGDRAVYHGTNQIAELTGHPTAELPEGKITDAEVLIWDRAQNKLFGRKIKASGEFPAKTNQTDLLPPK